MLHYKKLPDHVLLLKDANVTTAIGYLQTFVTDYKMAEWRPLLNDMVEACLTSDSCEYAEPGQRADLLLRKDHLMKLIEAAFVIAAPWVRSEIEEADN